MMEPETLGGNAMRWFFVLLTLVAVPAVFAAERAALVIGNANYEVGRLTNPVNDATDVAAALKALDFDVTLATDLDREGMLEQLDVFRQKVQPGGLSLVYYSGHGVEAGGENWLLPVHNWQIGTQAKVRIHSVSAQDLLSSVEDAGARLNILILDACRDNPLPAGARSASRGLKSIDVGSSTLVAYSTSPGKTAADGEGRNSPYTAALLQVLRQRQVAVPDLFNQVGAEVLRSTTGAQVPWNSNTPIWPPIQLTTSGRTSAISQSQEQLGALGELRVEVSPGDASVYVDESYVGQGSQVIASLPPNTSKRVEARRDGYITRDISVYIKAGQPTEVRLDLSASGEVADEGNGVRTTTLLPNMVGTRWIGVAPGGRAVSLTFHSDGSVVYTDAGDTRMQWTREGNQISMVGVSTTKGEEGKPIHALAIVNGTSMAGSMEWSGSRSWEWNASLIEKRAGSNTLKLAGTTWVGVAPGARKVALSFREDGSVVYSDRGDTIMQWDHTDSLINMTGVSTTEGEEGEPISAKAVLTGSMMTVSVEWSGSRGWMFTAVKK